MEFLKNALELGIFTEKEYIRNHGGNTGARSEKRLYGLYNQIKTVLKHYGKVGVKAQGSDYVKKADMTVKKLWPTSCGITPFAQVSSDIVYRDALDQSSVVRGIEVRAGSSNLRKNLHNNVRGLLGESLVFNSLITDIVGVPDNYFSAVVFINKKVDAYVESVGTLLAASNLGLNVCVVPYVERPDNSIVVLLTEVPESLNIRRLLN